MLDRESGAPKDPVPDSAQSRGRAMRLRQIAREFAHDAEFSRRVREMADELDAAADRDAARERGAGA